MIESILFDILGIFNLSNDVMDGNISVADSMAAMLSFPVTQEDSGSQWIFFHTLRGSFNSIFI